MDRIVNLVQECGAMQATREAAARQARVALDALSALPATEYRLALMVLAEQLIGRDH
jgi:octaprenyl-diphosphate synthase